MKWNDENCFLVMDLLRVYCLHRDSAQLLNSFDYGVKFLVFAAGCLKFPEKKYATLVLRFLCNLFEKNALVFLKNDLIILDLLKNAKKNFEDAHVNLIITMFLNYLSYSVQNQVFVQPN